MAKDQTKINHDIKTLKDDMSEISTQTIPVSEPAPTFLICLSSCILGGKIKTVYNKGTVIYQSDQNYQAAARSQCFEVNK